jgi:iron-sulfur cluster assembly protein
VSVASGGCAGLEYKLDIDDKTLPGEQVYESNGARVAADFKVQLYMGGSTIDYKESLMKSG